MSSSCSIHLGNYIMVVQPPTPRKPEPGSAIPPVPQQSNVSPDRKKKGGKQGPGEAKLISMKQISGHDMGALDFELAWLRFLREAEEEYQRRQCRSESNKPVSIFDMNVDVFESYLLKASGRALSATQHLNLNLTSAMVSHLKLFDTQHPEEPSEFEQDLEKEVELNERRAKRDVRRRKRRRITASFNIEEEDEEQKEEVQVVASTHNNHIQQQNPSAMGGQIPQAKQQLQDGLAVRKMLDSLNERDDVENSGEYHGQVDGKLQEQDPEFDVNDRSQTIQLEQPLLAQARALAATPMGYEIKGASTPPSNPMNIQDELISPIGNYEEEKMALPQQLEYQRPSLSQHHPVNVTQQPHRDFRTSQLYPDSIIHTEEGAYTQGGGHHGKIMIGDHSIDDNFGDDQTLGGDGQPNVEEDELNEDDMGNPFRQKSASFIKQQSIVSQGSIPMDTLANSGPYFPVQHNPLAGDSLVMPVHTTLDIPVRSRDDFAFMQSPSMPEVHGGEGTLQSTQRETKEFIIDRIVEVEHPPRVHLHEEPPVQQHISPIETPIQNIPSTLVEEDITPIRNTLAAPNIAEEHRPTTAQGQLQVPAIVMEERPLTAGVEQMKVVMKPESREVVLQTSFEEERQVEQETEVVMRFEIAVGQTPPNNRSLIETKEPGHDEAVGGSTPMSLVDAAQQLILGNSKLLENGQHDLSRDLQSDQQNVSHHTISHHSHHEDKWDKSRSRLEVTLTAEPDKPIIVEVRGGEKQFLISALTRHIYDILSQPHRLQLGGRDSGMSENNLDEEEEQEHQDEMIRISKNVNLKLKSVKKNRNARDSNISDQAITIEHLDMINSKLLESVKEKSDRSEIIPHALTSSIAQQNLAEPQRNTERQGNNQQISKRSTEEAYADAKIREEEAARFTQIFEVGEDLSARKPTTQQSNCTVEELLSNDYKHEPPSNFQEMRRRDTRTSLHQEQVMSDEVIMNYQMLRSRPETATFNQEHPMVHVNSQTELPPINMKSSQLSNRLIEQQHQPRPHGVASTPALYEEKIIYTELKTRASRRAHTPEDTNYRTHHHQSIIEDHTGVDFINSTAPVEVEQFSLPPLQPTIPMPHPNGYFSSDAGGDYMLMTCQDSQNYLHHNDISGGEDVIPQVNYYEGQQHDGTYYQYSPNGYPEQQVQQQNEEYILAEGYLLHFKDGQKGIEEVVDRQVYDLSRNHPPILNNSQTNLRRQATHDRSGYPPHHPASKKVPKLPVVNAKKRLLGQSSQTNNYYGMNGGPVYRTVPYTPARSLSPLRRKNFVHYTTVNAAEQAHNSTISNNFHEPAYYSQSPQQSRMKPSPYMSDDEFKILHDFYDIQCEPTGLHRGGVPLMRVKRINRPRAAINDEANNPVVTNGSGLATTATTNNGTNKAMSSLQIFYPQYNPNSPFKQELLLSRTLATSSKWFDRFYQSTRNLNQTISNLHKQHNRKLRSYSVSSLSSGDVVATGGVQGLQGVRSSSRELNTQQPLFTQQPVADQSMDTSAQRGSMPVAPMDPRYQPIQEARIQKKVSASVKMGGAVFMPPLNKVYTANMSQDQAHAILQAAAERGQQQQLKKNKLPPRPANVTSSSGSIFKQQQAEKKTSGAAPVIIPPPVLLTTVSSDGGENGSRSVSAAT